MPARWGLQQSTLGSGQRQDTGSGILTITTYKGSLVRVSSLPGAKVVHRTPHLAGTRQYVTYGKGGFCSWSGATELTKTYYLNNYYSVGNDWLFRKCTLGVTLLRKCDKVILAMNT